MSRLHLTLDQATLTELKRQATKAKMGLAAFARELLREAITRRDEISRRRKLAHDYAAGRSDAVELLRDLEAPRGSPIARW